MLKKSIYMICLFLLLTAPASADEAAETGMFNDEELVSYISGRLKLALSVDQAVEQYCDQSGCFIVVQ